MNNLNPVPDFPNYNPEGQTNYYNYNLIKYQPSFHTVDPRLNFVNKAPLYTSEQQVSQVYYPDDMIKYDLTLQSPEVEIEQKTDDELYIETWLSKIGKIQINLDSTIEIISSRKKPAKKFRNSVKLSNAKQSLRKCLNIIKKLEIIQEELRNNVDTISSLEWKKKTVDIGNLKSELTSLSLQFDNIQAVTLLNKSIIRRRKKRLNQQKGRVARKIAMTQKRENNKKISDDIDQWLENMKDEVEKAKMEEKMQKDADCVLAEVTMKKSDARKQLSLISGLIKLRNIRESQAIQRGEKVSLEDRSAFNKLTEKLTNMWEDTTKIYLKEEQCLKLMLESSVKKDTDLQISKSDKIIEQWDYFLFGPKCIPSQTYWGLTSADKNMENFIAIRKSWDTFLVDGSNEVGSRIPTGWCLPSVSASASWTKYLQDIF